MGVALSSYERHELSGFVAAMDPGAFRLLLMNLIGGALRAASRVASHQATVAVKAFAEKDTLRIEIHAPWGWGAAAESETRNPVVRDPNPDPLANRVIREVLRRAGGKMERQAGDESELLVVEIPRFAEAQ